MIHTKCMIIDGLFSMIGSSNLDARSSEINEELDVIVYDQEFGGQMEAMFARDLEKSREIHPRRIQASHRNGTGNRMADTSLSLAALGSVVSGLTGRAKTELGLQFSPHPVSQRIASIGAQRRRHGLRLFHLAGLTVNISQ